MTFSPGDVVRLKCGDPAMVVTNVRPPPYTGDSLCVWIVHTSVAREWFVDAALQRVTSAPSRDMALNMWATGAPLDEIAKATGYVNALTVKQIVSQARKAGEPRAMARAPGRKPLPEGREAKEAATEGDDPFYRMES